MRRLLQGDVGSGKTLVALLAALTVIEAGHQAALMAPTELLAEQHLETVRPLAAPLGVEPVLLTGAVKGKARRTALAGLADGTIPLAVGTHALIQEGVGFARLGLAIVDEQHRFGVLQRAALQRRSAESVDVLVMSATPIPRTLALTLYGDLAVSTLDELPPGRIPIATELCRESRREGVYERVRDRDRARRALRPGAAPPAPRPRRPGPRARPLLPRRAGLDGRRGLPASPHPRAVDRRLPHRRGRPGAAGAGRLPRHAAGGTAGLPGREPAPRRGAAARRARRGARVAGGGSGAVTAGVGDGARGAGAPVEGAARARARGLGPAPRATSPAGARPTSGRRASTPARCPSSSASACGDGRDRDVGTPPRTRASPARAA